MQWWSKGRETKTKLDKQLKIGKPEPQRPQETWVFNSGAEENPSGNI